MSDSTSHRNLTFLESPTVGISTETLDALKSKAWLRAMMEQGEDRIWRGAEMALRYLIRAEIQLEQAGDGLLELIEAVQMEADGEMGISGQLAEALLDARTRLAKVDAMWVSK